MTSDAVFNNHFAGAGGALLRRNSCVKQDCCRWPYIFGAARITNLSQYFVCGCQVICWEISKCTHVHVDAATHPVTFKVPLSLTCALSNPSKDHIFGLEMSRQCFSKRAIYHETGLESKHVQHKTRPLSICCEGRHCCWLLLREVSCNLTPHLSPSSVNIDSSWLTDFSPRRASPWRWQQVRLKFVDSTHYERLAGVTASGCDEGQASFLIVVFLAPLLASYSVTRMTLSVWCFCYCRVKSLRILW